MYGGVGGEEPRGSSLSRLAVNINGEMIMPIEAYHGHTFLTFVDISGFKSIAEYKSIQSPFGFTFNFGKSLLW